MNQIQQKQKAAKGKKYKKISHTGTDWYPKTITTTTTTTATTKAFISIATTKACLLFASPSLQYTFTLLFVFTYFLFFGYDSPHTRKINNFSVTKDMYSLSLYVPLNKFSITSNV
uniref:Uncharacterized protein n=1 Tax=Glossina brevipalpis TaxID=37001 RepID=A0A1A9WQK4_9MUSC